MAPELTKEFPVTSAAGREAPEIDEDWQVIYQQWRPEHWEILRLLCQGQTLQFTAEERKKQRPISLLLDEINGPVDEQLNDLLIDSKAFTVQK